MIFRILDFFWEKFLNRKKSTPTPTQIRDTNNSIIDKGQVVVDATEDVLAKLAPDSSLHNKVKAIKKTLDVIDDTFDKDKEST
jgi:hypothetical protein